MPKPATVDIEAHAVKYPAHAATHPFDPLTYCRARRCGAYHPRERPFQFGHALRDRSLREIRRVISCALMSQASRTSGSPTSSFHDGRSRATIEATVSLSRRSVLSFGPTRHQGQAPITPDEFVEVEIACKMSTLVADALRKRGLDLSDRNLVCVDPWSAGYFGDDENPQNRVARATFYLRKEVDDMQYAHPIEGLTALVDLYRKEVIKIEDAGVTAVPQTQRNYDRRFIKKFRDDLKPLEIRQPEGPSFKVNGWEVTWQRWRFRVGFTPREGLVLNESGTTTSTRARNVPSSIGPQSWK